MTLQSTGSGRASGSLGGLASVKEPSPTQSGIEDLATELLRSLPPLLTAAEVAAVLRTTRAAVYARAERGQLPGVIRDRRRLLVDRVALIEWLETRRAPSLGTSGR